MLTQLLTSKVMHTAEEYYVLLRKAWQHGNEVLKKEAGIFPRLT